MLTKLTLILFGILTILNSVLLIATIHYYKRYNALKNDYTTCTNNLKKVTINYNNLLNECTISLKKYKENIAKFNKRSNEVKSLIDKYKEIRSQESISNNECEQMKNILDRFIEIDNEVKLKLGGQR